MPSKQMMKPGYYLYGYGQNQSVLYVSNDNPPVLFRFDQPEEWVDVGEVGAFYERWFNGETDGPFDKPPAGVPPVKR